MKKVTLVAAALVILVVALRIHSQAEQGSPQTDQRGRFQIVFNPEAVQTDQTYLLDTESGNVWWFKIDGGKKVAVSVEKTK
jgi:hypothetical protein